MKSSASALIGAVMVTGAWVSLPAVAFAAEAGVRAAPSVAGEARSTTARQRQSNAGSERGDAHGHAACCTCAGCISTRAS